MSLYAEELAQLPATYQWCRNVNIDPLARLITGLRRRPVCFVGSGGSFGTATFASFVHEFYAHRLARAATPLEGAASAALQENPVMFFSASGKNADITGAFRAIAKRKPPLLAALCAASESPLKELAKMYSFAEYCGYDMPSRGDGFVATNSLLMSICMLLRAYWKSFEVGAELPTWQAVTGAGDMEDTVNRWFQSADKLWKYCNLLVLHGPAGRPAAVDLECRFHEAALAAVQVADFRNFGHGRHHWLKRMYSTTGVLSLESEEDEHIAERTLNLIPNNIERARIRVKTRGPGAAMALMVASIYLAGQSGMSVNIDPGCPGVADFGRQISRMNVWNDAVEGEF